MMNKENCHPNHLPVRSGLKYNQYSYLSNSRNIPSILRRKRKTYHHNQSINSWPTKSYQQQSYKPSTSNAHTCNALVPATNPNRIRTSYRNFASTIPSSSRIVQSTNIRFAPDWWAKRPRVRDQQLPTFLWRNLHKRRKFSHHLALVVYRDRASILGLTVDKISKLFNLRFHQPSTNQVIIEQLDLTKPSYHETNDSIETKSIQNCTNSNLLALTQTTRKRTRCDS